jgi:hypothetical protein
MNRYLLLFDSYGVVLCGVLSDERTGLAFGYAAGPREYSLSRVRVPWDSWPYFTVSGLRLPVSSPPTTRRVTVELFDPASTRVNSRVRVRVRFTLRLVVYCQWVRLGALNTCGDSPYITSYLTREWVCHLQLRLALASAFILGPESRGTRDHNLLSQIRDTPFCGLVRHAGLRWKYSTLPPHNWRLRLITCPSFITRGDPNKDHHIEQFVYYSVSIHC